MEKSIVASLHAIIIVKSFCRPTLVKGDIAVDFSVRTSVCPFLVKVFCLLISQFVFIGLLLYFTYSFLKTLAIHSQGIFVNKICFY